MDYTVKFNFQQCGDTPSLSKVAEAMARLLTTGGDPNRYHHRTYVQILGRICKRLMNDVHSGALKVCDQYGLSGNLVDIVKACPMAKSKSGYPAIFTLYVRQKHLADWGALAGDTFSFQDTGNKDIGVGNGLRGTLALTDVEFLNDRTVNLNTASAGSATLIDWGELVGDIYGVQDSENVDTLVNKDTPIALKSPTTKSPTNLSNAVEPGSDGTAKPNWRHLIQAEAWEYWLRLRASGCNPSVHSICPAMARWCQEHNIKGEKGQNPAVGTIRNAVLGAGHWIPPHHSVAEAQKYISQVAQTAQSKVAQI